MNEQQLNNLSTNFFKNIFSPIRNITIDFECLRDVKLGALLSLISTETEYKYILSKIQSYNKSLQLFSTDNFPALKIANIDLDKYIKDESNHRRLSLVSPVTDMYESLTELVSVVHHNNNRSVVDVNNWNLYICCGDLKPNLISKKALINLLESSQTKLNLHFVKGHSYQQSIDFLKQQDHIVVNDVIKFINTNNSSGDLLFNKYGFYKTSIMARTQFDNNLKRDAEETIDLILDRTSKYLDIFCNFKFITLNTLMRI